MKKLDDVDPVARAAALTAAQLTDSGPFHAGVRAPFTGYAGDLAPMGATGRPALASLGYDATRHDVPGQTVVPSDADDAFWRETFERREWDARIPGQGEREAMRLEKRMRRLLRRLDGGATTYEASIRRLALMGRLSKKPKSCVSCDGTGIDAELLNIANDVPCAACCGTGHNPIVPRKRPLAGFLDPYRYTYTLDGTRLDVADDGTATLVMLLHDKLADRETRVRARAFRKSGPKGGRPSKGARCAKGMHKWNEDSTRKWCIACGTERKKK